MGGATTPGRFGISGTGIVSGFGVVGVGGGVSRIDGSKAVMRRVSIGGIGKDTGGVIGGGVVGIVAVGTDGADGAIGIVSPEFLAEAGIAGVSAGNFIFGIGGGVGGVLGVLIAAMVEPASPSFLARSKSCAIVRIEYWSPCVAFFSVSINIIIL